MLNFKSKPIIAMLHLKGYNENDCMERFKRETDIYYSNGVDAVLVENYFGSVSMCEYALEYLKGNMSTKCYGVNILGNYAMAFDLAEKYGADFIQIDSVCGHLPPERDSEYETELKKLRISSDTAVLGGVRFKYQPILSGRTLSEDIQIGKTRCDAVVTTGDGTGVDCPIEKLAEFKELLGDFPLVVGAGVTANTVADKLKYADAVIIGSWLKTGHKAENEVSEKYVREFIKRAKDARLAK